METQTSTAPLESEESSDGRKKRPRRAASKPIENIDNAFEEETPTKRKRTTRKKLDSDDDVEREENEGEKEEEDSKKMKRKSIQLNDQGLIDMARVTMKDLIRHATNVGKPMKAALERQQVGYKLIPN